MLPPWRNEARPPSYRKGDVHFIPTIPEPAVHRILQHSSYEIVPVSALFRSNIHSPTNTAPCPIHYITLPLLIAGSVWWAVGCVFLLSVRTAALPRVPTAAASEVTTSLFTATQARSLSARSGFPTAISIPGGRYR